MTPTSYYGRPILKEPTWRWLIPAYLWSGGLASGTALAGAGARALGDEVLARRCALTVLGAVGVSGALLVGDLGRPERFHHMLRVAKPTSPMSVGTWIFSGFGAAAGLAALEVVALSGKLIRAGGRAGMTVSLAGRLGTAGAALLAPPLATYTAVLLADTAVPAWHEAHRQLPWLFAGSAAASGGAAATLLALPGRSQPGHRSAAVTGACRLALVGAVVELVAERVMHRSLQRIETGDPEAPHLAFPYEQRPVRELSIGAGVATAAGAVTLASARTRRLPAAIGALGLLGGAALERFAIVAAGRRSARHPAYTVGPQRAGLVPGGGPA